MSDLWRCCKETPREVHVNSVKKICFLKSGAQKNGVPFPFPSLAAFSLKIHSVQIVENWVSAHPFGGFPVWVSSYDLILFTEVDVSRCIHKEMN